CIAGSSGGQTEQWRAFKWGEGAAAWTRNAGLRHLAPPTGAARARSTGSPLRGWVLRDREGEPRATVVAVDADAAAMRFYDVAYDVEPEPYAARGVRGRGGALHGLENAPETFRRNGRTVVQDAHADGAAVGDALDADGRIRGAISKCIREQVVDHLRHAVDVDVAHAAAARVDLDGPIG